MNITIPKKLDDKMADILHRWDSLRISPEAAVKELGFVNAVCGYSNANAFLNFLADFYGFAPG